MSDVQEYEVTPGVFATILIAICISSAACMFFYMDSVRCEEIRNLTEEYVNSMNDINISYDNEINVLNSLHSLEQENLTSYFAGEMIELNSSHIVTMNNLNNTHEIVETNLLQQLAENISEINLLKEGDVFNLHQPTYLEVLEFLEEDKTDENEYVDIIYECDEFSQDVNSNAELLGIRTAVVLIEMEGGGHLIVGFNTIDSGMVYFEPQCDEQVFNVEVGNDACDDCNMCFGYLYNHIITSINIYW